MNTDAYVFDKLSELLPITRKDSYQKYQDSLNTKVVIRGIETSFGQLWKQERGTDFSNYCPKNVEGFNRFLKRLSVLNNAESLMKTIYKDKSNADHRATLSKKFGEVFTPEDLVDEVLNALPKDVWNDPAKKWLDPACGSGNFLIKVYDRLMKSLAEAIPNEGDRRKHILEEMIFGIELRALNCIWTSSRLDPDEKYKLNIVCHDSLTYDCKFGGKNPTGMFDVVVGNPPFQLIEEDCLNTDAKHSRRNTRKLYIEFTEVFVPKTDLLSFIAPSGWISKKSSKMYKITSSQISNPVVVAKERMEIDLPVCYFTYSKSSPSVVAPLLLNIPVAVNLGDIFNYTLHVYRNDIRLHKGSTPIVEIVGAVGKPPTFTTIESMDTSTQPHFNLWKVVVNYVGGYTSLGALKIVAPGYATSTSVLSFGVSSEEEAKTLKAYMESSLVKYFVSHLKQTTVNALHIFKQIPLVDISRSWTDQEIYEHFKLTPEQINEIEEVTK